MGAPIQKISDGNTVRTVAILGQDFVGIKPTMLVQVGDKISKGQSLFEDKKTPGVIFTSPVSGTVREINRGEKRVFQSIVIAIDSTNKINFKNFAKKNTENFSTTEVRALLIESGACTFLRTRRFSKSPAVDSTLSSIFINVMDTNPLAADPEIIVAERLDDFKAVVMALSKLAPKIFVVTAPGSRVEVKNIPNVVQEEFRGPHRPATLELTFIILMLFLPVKRYGM